MKALNIIAAAIALSAGILTATAYAHQGEGRGEDHGMRQGEHQGMMQGQRHGMEHEKGSRHAERGEGRHGGMGHDSKGTAKSLMSQEERTAFRDKMRNAKTPEERQQIALANRAEMEKRAAEKGITLPEHRGQRHQRGEEHKH